MLSIGSVITVNPVETCLIAGMVLNGPIEQPVILYEPLEYCTYCKSLSTPVTMGQSVEKPRGYNGEWSP